MWTPAEIRRLIAQIAGVGLAIGGFILLIQGVRATGHINISSSLLSGEIESGSAGLFLLFLGFLLIALPIFWHSPSGAFLAHTVGSPASTVEPRRMTYRARLALATTALFALTLALLFGGELLSTKYAWRMGEVLVVAGVGLGLITTLTGIITLVEWTGGGSEKLEEPTPDA